MKHLIFWLLRNWADQSQQKKAVEAMFHDVTAKNRARIPRNGRQAPQVTPKRVGVRQNATSFFGR